MLHLPSYELGILFGAFDYSAGNVKTGHALLSAILSIPDSTPSLDPIGLVPSSFKEGYEHEVARHSRVDHPREDCRLCVNLSHVTEVIATDYRRQSREALASETGRWPS